MGSDSVPDYARALAAAVDARGFMDEDTWATCKNFQRAFGRGLRSDGVYDEVTATAVAAAGKISAPCAFSHGATFGAEVNIAAVQQRLNDLGYKPVLLVDGVAGQKTQAAVKWFQSQKGLQATGVLDAVTVSALAIPPGSVRKSPIVPVAAPSVAGLWQSVVDAFFNFTRPLEGYTPYLYTDSKGFVTTGMGNLVESKGQPTADVFALPWKKPDGSLASRAEIAAAWQTVKSAWPKVQSSASQSLTTLRLSEADVAKLVSQKMAQNQAYLASKYPGMSQWPADAQMAIHALSWAWGAGFASVWGTLGQNFAAAVNASPPDFARAASIMQQASAHEESINPGLVPRDKAVALMLENAAEALTRGSDLGSLLYPNTFEAGMRAAIALERAIPFWVKVTAFVVTISGLGLLTHSLLKKS